MVIILTLLALWLATFLLIVCAYWPRAQAPASRSANRPVPEVEASASLVVVAPAVPVPIQQRAPQTVTRSLAVITVRPTAVIIVEPPPIEAWKEKGWIQGAEGTTVVYDGYFQVTERESGRKRRFLGKVKMEAGMARPYIADPPDELFTNHVKAACLREWREAPWWWLNWARPARTVDQAIFYMERILDEAIND